MVGKAGLPPPNQINSPRHPKDLRHQLWRKTEPQLAMRKLIELFPGELCFEVHLDFTGAVRYVWASVRDELLMRRFVIE